MRAFGKVRGLTLVEIIVAAVILSGAVAGILASFRVGRRATNLASHRMEALDFAQEALEELKGKVMAGDEEYFAPGCHINPDICDFEEGTPFHDIFGGERSYIVDPDEHAGDYRIVKMTVTWSEP